MANDRIVPEVSRRTLLAAGAAIAIAPLPTLAEASAPVAGGLQGKTKMEPKLVRVPTEEDIAKALNTASKGISEATHKAHLTLWQGYANKTNEIRQKLAGLDYDPAKANQIYSEVRALRVNYAFAQGGYKNHQVYFGTIGGNGGPATGAIAQEIDKAFGSFENFAKQWKATGIAARGWAYLGYSRDEQMLQILIGDSQDTYHSFNHALVLALDVYEHAYFLDFQTKRPAYIDAYMNCIDWDASNEFLAKAKAAL